MCILLETKLNAKNLDMFLAKWFPGWDFFSNLDAHSGGRILILWRKDLFDVNVKFVSNQMVHCKVDIMGDYVPFDFL